MLKTANRRLVARMIAPRQLSQLLLGGNLRTATLFSSKIDIFILFWDFFHLGDSGW